MTQITCPDCENTISANSDHCPHCDFPIREYLATTSASRPNPKSGIRLPNPPQHVIIQGLLIALTVLTVFIASMLYIAHRHKQRAPAKVPPTTPVEQPATDSGPS